VIEQREATDVVPMLIGGELRPSSSGETIDAVNPATGAILGRIPRASAADVDDAVQAAADAFPDWRATAAVERAGLLVKLAERLIECKEELAQLDALDNGSPIRSLRTDVELGAAELRYFAGLALQARGETIPTTHGRLNYTLREPWGVVGRIVPFNHPLLFATMKVGAPLVTGNTLVLKPSEHTSLSALRLAEEFRCIFPPGVINVVTGYGAEAGDALVAHPAVRRMAFIGAAETGRRILARAAEVTIKTITLELGGKNPIVVLPDADLELAIDGAVQGMNLNFQGQSCGSTSRLLVHESLHADFVERMKARLDAIRIGMPTSDETQMGTMVNRPQLEKVESYVRLGRDDGFRLVTGGHRPDDPELENGFFIRPALFDGVSPGSRLEQEEIFGPVLATIPFGRYEDALAIANAIPLGLTASVFTRDLEVAHAFARDVEAGFVWVNDSGPHFPGAPFGGFKDSGLGREEESEELLSYTQTKNVNVRFQR
jgi:acyl-CoA reductase-like NAD-dependent aldehyde dehydrogenase